MGPMGPVLPPSPLTVLFSIINRCVAAALCSHDVLAVVLVLLPTTLKHASVSASMGARAAPQKFLRVAVRARSLVRVAVASCCPQLLCTFFPADAISSRTHNFQR
jgi:hypothetical protein